MSPPFPNPLIINITKSNTTLISISRSHSPANTFPITGNSPFRLQPIINQLLNNKSNISIILPISVSPRVRMKCVAKSTEESEPHGSEERIAGGDDDDGERVEISASAGLTMTGSSDSLSLGIHEPVYKMEDESSLYTLDEAFSTIRFGKYQMIVLAFAGLGWVAEAMEIMLLSFVGPNVKFQWGLSSNQESMITTVVFAGMLVGAYWWGFVSDTYGRTKSLLGVSLVTSVGGILSAFSANYVWLVTLRLIVGFGVGGGHVFSSWFLEFVPAPNRGTWMVIFSTFWTVGTIFEASLAWIVMPTLGWRWLLGVSALPSLSFLVFYGLLAESPRYLCMKGRTGEAYQVLKEIALLNRTKLPPGKLVSDQAAISENEKLVPSEDVNLLSSTKSYSSTVLVLFSSELIRTTFLLWVVYFGNTFAYYGIVLLTSELSSGQSQCGSHPFVAESNSDSYLYINVFVTSCAELPGLALAAVIVDKVGRKCSMEIMLLLGFVLLLPLILQPNEILTTALLFGARMFISASFIVACIYAPEVYPTSVRSTGVGVATAIGRVGGMLCPLVAVALVSGCHQGTAIVLFEVVLLLVGLCVMLFPFETKGKELSDAVSAPSRTEVTDDIVQ